MSKQRGKNARPRRPVGEHAAGDEAPAMLPTMEAMFQAARTYLLGTGSEASARHPIATNAKGQLTRGFDAQAERLALDVATRHLGAYRAFSEELGEVRVGRDPQWTLVLDPCDGSNNFRRGVRGVGFAVAALPGAEAALDPDRVEYALCGDIFSGTVYAAARGRGATCDGQLCQSSALGTLGQAMLSVNLGRTGPRRDASADLATTGAQPPIALPEQEMVWRLIPQVSAVRRIGATVLDLCYVAQGAFDAYVDLRQRLTPENFMAPALIIREAGGIFSDGAGRPLGAVEFSTPYTVIAAGNAELHAKILRTLGVLVG